MPDSWTQKREKMRGFRIEPWGAPPKETRPGTMFVEKQRYII